MLLERVLVDFGADESFSVAVKKVQEHYGVSVACSTTRLDVERHARKIGQSEGKYFSKNGPHKAAVIIGEMDGSMVPIVAQKESTAVVVDKRKNKTHEWREARLALARPKGSTSPLYAATMGSIDATGRQLALVVNRAGEGEKTKVHCLGDGAPWIAEQVEQLFGSKATFTLDFYHVSEHLAEASNCCQPDAPKQFLHRQQERLKNNQTQKVLSDLQEHFEHPCQLKDKCPAFKCHNYLSKRLNQLDYKSAIGAGLPIGSGEIESGHRSVVQKRLKIPGAWWTIGNAGNMLSLRTLRANGQWNAYWNDQQSTGAGRAIG
jgi:hypothetical protein